MERKREREREREREERNNIPKKIFLKKSGKTPEYGEKKANKRCLQGSVGTGDEKVMKK